jgi:hypothetical protein
MVKPSPLTTGSGAFALAVATMVIPQAGPMTQEYATYLFWAAIGLGVLATINYILGDTLHWLKEYSVMGWTDHFGRKISLREAAAEAYGEFRQKKAIWAEASEKLGSFRRDDSKKEDGILEFIAQLMVGNKIKMFGVRPPSSKLELIDPEDLKHCAFGDGGKSLRVYGAPKYIDLMINRSDLRQFIKEKSKQTDWKEFL